MRSLTLALVILAGTVAVPGQLSQGSVLDVKIGPVTTINKAEFDAAVMRMKYPPSEWRGKGVRIIFRYKDDQEKPSGIEQANDNKEVFEYDAAGSAREFWELGPWARPATGERVFIADEVFSRVDGGSWTRTAEKVARKNVYKMFLADTEQHVNKLAELPATIEVTYDAGVGTYMGKPSRIYSRTLRENITNRTTGEGIASVKVFRYWLSDSFRLVKMEQLYTHYTKARMIRQNFVTEFAFDPSIVINRPPIP